MEDIVDKFSALKLHERKTALHTLVDSLDPYEWRILRDKLQERTFQVDLVGSPKMPFELVMHICSYLDMYDIFRNQRVSKSWQRLLSAPKIIDEFIRPWYGAFDPPLLCEQVAAHSRDEAYIRRRKIEHIHRLRICEPVTGAACSFGTEWYPTVNDTVPHCNFNGEIFAWVDEREDGKLKVMNVRTGSFHTATMPGREHIFNLVLTATYVVCMPHSGYAYAFGIDDVNNERSQLELRAQIRLPSISKTMWGEENLVAFLFKEGEESATYSVIIWDMSKDKSHSFQGNAREARCSDGKPIPDTWPISPECMILHEPSQRLTIISITWDNSFAYQTFSLKGELLNQRFVRELTALPDRPEEVTAETHGFLYPVPNNLVVDYSSYRVNIPVYQYIGETRSLRPNRRITTPDDMNLFLYFDFMEQTLSLMTLPQSQVELQAYPDNCRWLTWNSLIYEFDRCYLGGSSKIVFPYIVYDHTKGQKTVSSSTIRTSLHLNESLLETSEGNEVLPGDRYDIDVLGNDRYLVLVTSSAFFVFYFDPDTEIATYHLQFDHHDTENSDGWEDDEEDDEEEDTEE